MFYLIIIGFILGVALESIFLWDVTVCALVAVISLALLLYAIFVGNRKFLILAVLPFALTLGLVRTYFSFPTVSPPPEKAISFEAIVITEPEKRESRQRLVVEPTDDVLFGRILVWTDLFPEYQYGDKIKISGKAEIPENFTNENGREFNYIGYLYKDEIYYQMYDPEITYLEAGQGNPIKHFLFSTKNSFLEKIESVIPEPKSSLAGGVLLGVKQSLGDEVQNMFRRTGVVHIIVLSGYNVSIIVDTIAKVFGFLPLLAGGILSMFSIIAFALLTGASATIVRASVMAILVVIARLTGRTYAISRALFAAGFIMVLHNPKILLFDISFQLSFLATFSLIALAPHISKTFFFVTEKWNLREIISATLATQIFVLPILVYSMGEVSLIAPIANVLVLPMIPFAMLSSFLTGIFAYIGAVVAWPLGFVANILLSYTFFIVDLLSRLPFAAVSLPPVSIWIIFLWYAIYGLILWFTNREERVLDIKTQIY